MENENKPEGGVRLDMGFGTRPETPASRGEIDVPFRLVVVGDFGGAGDGRLTDVSGDDISSLLASFGANASLDVPNRLGSTPPALAVHLAFQSLRDLDPKTIAARVPEIAQAERLAAAFVDRRLEAEFEVLSRDPALDLVVSELQRSLTPISAPPPPARPSPDDDGSVDRLLGMVDLGSARPSDAANSAISAFIASTASPKPRPASAGAMPHVVSLLQSQAREVANHPTWLRLEAAWRSLRLIFTARGRCEATRLALCDVAADAIPDLLENARFADALADGPELAAVLVLGAFDSSPKALDALDRLASAAERLSVPVIVSLAPDFLGTPPKDVATMDDPGALLEGPAHAAWRGLRGRAESGFLFAAWNDFVLRPADALVPALWGEPGVILAAQTLRSMALHGWPTEIAGAQTAMDGFDLVDMEVRGGRTAAIPLRAPLELGVSRELAKAGILSLVCRTDRDQLWFTSAASVHGAGPLPEADRKIMETFNSLPFRFVSRAVEDVLHRNRALLVNASSPQEAAMAMSRLLEDVLRPTGPEASAKVAPAEGEGEGRHFDVSVRLGQQVMGGFSFSFDISL